MSRFRVRTATLSDLHVLVRHRRGMWESMGERDRHALDEADRVYRRWARQRMETARLVGFVVETGKRDVVASGCIWLRPVQPLVGYSARPVPYLLSMYTDPAHRRHGLGTRIVRAAIRWCRDHRYPRLTLHASTQGRTLYRKLGFDRTWEMRIKLRPREMARSVRRTTA